MKLIKLSLIRKERTWDYFGLLGFSFFTTLFCYYFVSSQDPTKNVVHKNYMYSSIPASGPTSPGILALSKCTLRLSPFGSPEATNGQSCRQEADLETFNLGQVDSKEVQAAASFAAALQSSLADTRRGDFSQVMNYLQVTINCRNVERTMPELVRLGYGCPEADLAIYDNEMERLLEMGSNQQNASAEIALARWFLSKAYRAEDDQEDPKQLSGAKDQTAIAPDVGQMRLAYQANLDKAIAVLDLAEAHNPEAADLLKLVHP